jgi:hypothetical protein
MTTIAAPSGAYVSKSQYDAERALYQSLQKQISAAQATLQQQAQEIASLQAQLARLQAQPHIVGYRDVYVSNTYSCLYHYDRYAVYSNGTTKLVGTVTKQEGHCAGLPPIQYVYLKYLSNTDSCYYHYAVMAHFLSGGDQQVGTVTIKRGNC